MAQKTEQQAQKRIKDPVSVGISLKQEMKIHR